MRLFNNKKGSGQEIISDILVYTTFVLVIVVFLILFSFKSKSIENKLEVNYENQNAQLILQNILKTPVEYKKSGDIFGKEVLIMDLMGAMIYSNDVEAKNVLDVELKKILNNSIHCSGQDGKVRKYGLIITKERFPSPNPINHPRGYTASGFSLEKSMREKYLTVQVIPWNEKNIYVFFYKQDYDDNNC
jgi:hypothetical protein